MLARMQPGGRPVSASLPLDAAVPATRARWTLLVFLVLLSFVLYLDRVCLGQAAIPIQKELGLSNTQLGLVHLAFTLAYGLFEIPVGRWGDLHGSRGVLTRIVVWWSAFTALTGAAAGFTMLLLTRFLFGAGEAGAFPNTARVLARWFPSRERGLAQGMVLTAAQVGGAIAPLAAAYLIAKLGWRWAFAVFGAVGSIWAAAFYAWFRDDPAEHRGVNEAERELIARGTDASTGPGHRAPIPWGRVLPNINIWMLGGIMTCSAFASYLYMSWFPKYLHASRGVSELEAGRLSSLVLAAGAVGCLSGGFIANWVARRAANPARAQRLYAFGALTLAGATLMTVPSCASPLAVAGLAGLAALTALSSQATWWAVATAISGRHLGALFGLMNSMGVVGAMSSQYFLGAFADWRGELGHTGRSQWDPALYVYGGALLIGACFWLRVDPARPVVEPAKEDMIK